MIGTTVNVFYIIQKDVRTPFYWEVLVLKRDKTFKTHKCWICTHIRSSYHKCHKNFYSWIQILNYGSLFQTFYFFPFCLHHCLTAQWLNAAEFPLKRIKKDIKKNKKQKQATCKNWWIYVFPTELLHSVLGVQFIFETFLLMKCHVFQNEGK